MQSKIYKIILLGDTSTGKSSFIKNYISNSKTRGMLPTVNFQALTVINTNPHKYIQIWDTPGAQKYRLLPQSILNQFDYSIVFYDITSSHTFNIAKKILTNLRNYYPNVVTILVGNKLDIVENNPTKRQILLKQAQALAKQCQVKNYQYCYNDRADKVIGKLLQTNIETDKIRLEESQISDVRCKSSCT